MHDRRPPHGRVSTQQHRPVEFQWSLDRSVSRRRRPNRLDRDGRADRDDGGRRQRHHERADVFFPLPGCRDWNRAERTSGAGRRCALFTSTNHNPCSRPTVTPAGASRSPAGSSVCSPARSSGDCDIFVAWTTISEDRTRLGVEWAIPYYSGSVAILTQSTPTMEQGWAFFKPFTWDLWVAMGVTAIVLPIIVRFDLARRALACPVCLSLSHTHTLARSLALRADLRARNPRDPPPNRGTGSGKRLFRVALEDALGVDPRRNVRREYDSCSARRRHLCVLRADIEFVLHCQPGRVPHDAELWRYQQHLRSPGERCEHCRGVSRPSHGAIPAAAQHRRHQQPGRAKDGGREDPGRRPFGRGHRYSRRAIHRGRSVRSRLPVAIAAGQVRTRSIVVGG